MKMILFSALFSALWVSAQTPPPGTISSTPSSTINSTNQPALGGLTITNRAGQAYSADQIQTQLRELHRAVEQTAPALTAITETYSNFVTATQPSTARGIAGVLGGILNRNKDKDSADSSSGKTNLLGSILQGVLGAAGVTNSTTTSSPAVDANTVRDLVALQEHLQAMQPILQRIDTSTTTNTTLSPTGR